MTRTGNFGIGVKEIQIFDGVDCTREITGTHTGPLNVDSGVTCVADGASVVGPTRVRGGAGLIATGASFTGPVSATGATTVQLLDSTIDGRVSVSGTTARVAIVDNRITGPVSVTQNVTGSAPIVISGNRITGPLACSGNQPAPGNGGTTNNVTGPKSGQCAQL